MSDMLANHKEPFTMMPQSVLYATALDALDIRLLLHFYATYRLKGERDTFEYSVPALQKVFPQYGRQFYCRRVKQYTAAGVLNFTRYKVIRGKRMPLYSFDPNKVEVLCSPARPHSSTPLVLCSPARPHKKEYKKQEISNVPDNLNLTLPSALNEPPKPTNNISGVIGVSSHSMGVSSSVTPEISNNAPCLVAVPSFKYVVSSQPLFECKLPSGVKNIPSPIRRKAILQGLNAVGSHFAIDNTTSMVEVEGFKVTAIDFTDDSMKVVLLTADDASYVNNIQPLCQHFTPDNDYMLLLWTADSQSVYQIEKEVV